jgi:haloacetate dehalogenase
MADIDDLMAGFEPHWISTSIGKVFARTGGSGPPLLLVHGYPQSHVMWHRVAPALAEHFTLVMPDLPGYGWSAAPAANPDHTPYTKRAMAAVMIEVMEAVGFVRFRLAGHDRGGRVGYRLALDHPGRVEALAVLDIVPTYAMWHGMDRHLAMKVWHWSFLAQPHPFPEMLIGKAPVEYLDWKMASWTKDKSLEVFDRRALDHYRLCFSDPSRIHASCEDYRAGQTADLADDEADRATGKRIACPVIALWGAAGIPSESGPLAVWREWANDVAGEAIDSGHFLCEENPAATSRALIGYFAR